MTTRYEIKSWRKSQSGKAYTVRVGSAWVDTKGITRLVFDALPVADAEGRVQAFLEEPRGRDASSEESQPAKPARAETSRRVIEEDSIPF